MRRRASPHPDAQSEGLARPICFFARALFVKVRGNPARFKEPVDQIELKEFRSWKHRNGGQ